MPCLSNRLESDFTPDINQAQIHINFLEACLCAIVSELVRQELYQDIIPSAQKNGKVDINSWWIAHTESDRKRLETKLSEFSLHEQLIIKQLIIKKEQK